ncbi:hypothetical protein BDZ45DRAFT_74583 [Acephala macrosclerotiorum]|nr:hypothetical protein BDZ45DRAFT_74583 [Acephala macrosclerotiorum]
MLHKALVFARCSSSASSNLESYLPGVLTIALDDITTYGTPIFGDLEHHFRLCQHCRRRSSIRIRKGHHQPLLCSKAVSASTKPNPTPRTFGSGQSIYSSTLRLTPRGYLAPSLIHISFGSRVHAKLLRIDHRTPATTYTTTTAHTLHDIS